jgi:hypothetical protein
MRSREGKRQKKVGKGKQAEEGRESTSGRRKKIQAKEGKEAEEAPGRETTRGRREEK